MSLSEGLPISLPTKPTTDYHLSKGKSEEVIETRHILKYL